MYFFHEPQRFHDAYKRYIDSLRLERYVELADIREVLARTVTLEDHLNWFTVGMKKAGPDKLWQLAT